MYYLVHEKTLNFKNLCPLLFFPKFDFLDKLLKMFFFPKTKTFSLFKCCMQKTFNLYMYIKYLKEIGLENSYFVILLLTSRSCSYKAGAKMTKHVQKLQKWKKLMEKRNDAIFFNLTFIGHSSLTNWSHQPLANLMYLVSESLWIINLKFAFVVNSILQTIIHLHVKQNDSKKKDYLYEFLHLKNMPLSNSVLCSAQISFLTQQWLINNCKISQKRKFTSRRFLCACACVCVSLSLSLSPFLLLLKTPNCNILLHMSF